MRRKRNNRKLRNLVVNKRQLAIILSGSVYLFISILGILAVTMSPVYQDIHQSKDISEQRESAKIFIIISEKLVLALIAFFVLTFLPLLWVTHKIFGPLINFSNIFKKVMMGDLTQRIYLRRGDLIKLEAQVANDMIESISNRIHEINRQNDLLVNTLNDLSNGRLTGMTAVEGNIATALTRALACRELLSNFTTDNPPN